MRRAAVTIFLVSACKTIAAQTATDETVSFSEREICRAAISTIMRHPVHRVRVERVARDGVVFLSYIRAEDRTTWTFKCFTEGKAVTWAKADGRWRVHPLDSTVTYSASDDSLTVTEDFGDGSPKQANFSKADLEKPYR